MRKQTIVLIPAVIIIVAGLGAGSIWWYFHLQHHPSQLGINNSSLASTSEAGSDTTSTATTPNQIGVSTASSNASMGQLSQTQKNTSNGISSTNQNVVGSSTTSNNSSSTNSDSAQLAKLLDPTTFSRYDTAQYVNGTTASYIDLLPGTGTEIAAGDQVAVYYKGWLTNGQLFDETKDDSSGQMQPFTFTYGADPSQVITGWEEGLEGMKAGGVRLLIIPPSVGYGASGNASIPGNSVLVFQVQLVAVQ